MKILVLCNKSPYPPKEGGSLAMYNIITGLLKHNCSVKVLAVSTPKMPINNNNFPLDFLQSTSFESVFIDVRPHLKGVLKNLFSNRSYHIERFINEVFEKKLVDILSKDTFDIVQFESLFMLPYIEIIRKHSHAKIVLRAHNIEHVIWQRIAQGEKNPIRKMYLKLQAKRLKKYELTHIPLCDGIATITDVDAHLLKENNIKTPIKTIPFGVDEKYLLEKSKTVREPFSIFFIGALNWEPNIEGLKWFLEHVWPSVTEINPLLKFYIAGRHTPDFLYHLKIKNVEVLGEVADAIRFMQSKSVMVVPLLSGSGMRIKIIEGMLAENAIISTPIGAEGIDYINEKHLVTAQNHEDFIRLVIKYAENSLLSSEMGKNAHTLITEKYNNTDIIKSLCEFYHQLNL